MTRIKGRPKKTPNKRRDGGDGRKLSAEILLAALDSEQITPYAVGEAITFLNNALTFNTREGRVAYLLDSLLILPWGYKPAEFKEKARPAQIIAILTGEMDVILRTYEQDAQRLFNLRIGKRVALAEDLEEKIRAACEERKEELLSVVRVNLPKGTIIGREAQQVNGELYEGATYSLVKLATDAKTIIERYRIGIPHDFYRDVCALLKTVSTPSGLFFLKELYEMITKEGLPAPYDKPPPCCDLIHFGNLLFEKPEVALPDPEAFKELKERVVAIENLKGGSDALYNLSALCDGGLDIKSAVQKLAKLPTGTQVQGALREIIEDPRNSAKYFVDLFARHPEFVQAYNLLKRLGYEREAAVTFLQDYGDYQVNGTTLAGVLQRFERRTTEVRLIVQNAAYICCGEESETMIALAVEPTGIHILQQYVRFAQEEQPYKQVAALRYVKHKGTKGLGEFVEHLQTYLDDEVGALLEEKEDAQFVEEVTRRSKREKAEELHVLKSLGSYGTLIRYGMIPDIRGSTVEALHALDEIIGNIQGTKYEAVLFGQRTLRRILLEQVQNNPNMARGLMQDLPEEGNPYVILRERLMPEKEELVPEGVDKETVIVERPREVYQRVLLFTGMRVPDETITYLTGELNAPFEVVNIDRSTERLTGIRKGDLVLYDTEHTGHVAYYRAKHIASRRGATFRHISSTNRDRMLEAVRAA